MEISLKKIAALDDYISKTITSNNVDVELITDGIVDVQKYSTAKYKILWILKEPYDESDGTGGGWDLREVIKSKQTIYEFKRSSKMFAKMTYISWGINNNFCQWNDMEDIENNPSMLEALKSIAYINVKKLPGFTSSQHSIIQGAYNQHKDILHKQIEVYNPDIIIGGGTLYNFYPDLNITNGEIIKERDSSVYYVIKDNKILVDAYHPSYWGISAEKYCNDIINAIKKWTTITSN